MIDKLINKIGHPKTDTCIHGTLIYDRSGIAKRWRNSNYSINGAGRIDYPFGEK